VTAPQLTQYVQGQGVVGADGLNTFEQTCDSVPQLRAFSGVQGMQVSIRGTSAPGDGGQGPFFWNLTAQNPTDDNGNTTIVPPGSTQGCWTRLGFYSANPSQPIAFSYTVGSAQTFTGSAAAQVIYSSKIYDFSNFVNNSSFSPPATGLYSFHAVVTHDGTGTAGDVWELGIQVPSINFTASTVQEMTSVSGSLSTSVDISLLNGQNVSVFLQRTSGSGTFTTVFDGTLNRFQGRVISLFL
jgi:hypothetical protein